MIGHFNHQSEVCPKQAFALLMSTDLDIYQILTGLTSIPPYAPIKQILTGLTSILPYAPIKQILTGLTNIPPYAPIGQILRMLNTISLVIPNTSILYYDYSICHTRQLTGDQIWVLDTSPNNTLNGRLSPMTPLSELNHCSIIASHYQEIKVFDICEAYHHINTQKKSRTVCTSLGMSPAIWKELLHNNTSCLDQITAFIAKPLLEYVSNNIHLEYILITVITVIIINFGLT